MPIVEGRQYRNLNLLSAKGKEKKIDTDFYVEGYAARYKPYKLYDMEDGPIYERFEREAFNNCDMSDVIMQYDHNGKVFARTSNKTLIVQPDNEGIFICADLGKTESSRSLYEEIRAGMITKMSWAFVDEPNGWYYDKDTRTIVHTSIKKMYDVSAVSLPANNDTEISARSLADGEISKVRQELLEQAKKKCRLKLKIGDFLK